MVKKYNEAFRGVCLEKRRENLKLNVVLVLESKALYFWRKRYSFPSLPSIDKWCPFTYFRKLHPF